MVVVLVRLESTQALDSGLQLPGNTSKLNRPHLRLMCVLPCFVWLRYGSKGFGPFTAITVTGQMKALT